MWTSAGVTAGMDLALALVEDDLGPQAALAIARQLVLFVRRPGGQAQFSTGLAAQSAERDALRELQDWMPGHLGDDLSVPALAARAHMSTRHFSRAFPGGRAHPGRLSACGSSTAACCWRARRSRWRRSPPPAALPPPRPCAVPSPAGWAPARPPTAAASRPPDPHHRGACHGHRHPPLRPLHRAGRHRPLRGALPHPGGDRHLAGARARPGRRRHAHARHPGHRALRGPPSPTS